MKQLETLYAVVQKDLTDSGERHSGRTICCPVLEFLEEDTEETVNIAESHQRNDRLVESELLSQNE